MIERIFQVAGAILSRIRAYLFFLVHKSIVTKEGKVIIGKRITIKNFPEYGKLRIVLKENSKIKDDVIIQGSGD
ncbi:MAG: hypothetical protein KKH99_01190, partial [Proteobacteria bacterium]|nr:hypothetical protein [Pseudomonadota bacterium]